MTYILVAAIIIIALAIVGKFMLNVSWLPVAAFIGVSAFLITPLTYGAGMQLGKSDALRFNEYWSGWEKEATSRSTTCVRDGSCVNTYSCDPYQVPESYTDSEGNVKTRMVTKWHDCPYSTQETSYYVSTTIGDTFTMGANLMTGKPFRSYERKIPGGQVTQPPAEWSAAKSRIESGNPGPVTAVKSYDNYILASQNTLFKHYEGDVETLLSQDLLPTPASGVTNYYHATKVYNVGNALDSEQFAQYRTDLSYLNGAVGTDLQGDLHLVFVPEDVALGPDTYSNSLLAYWQSESLGRNAISKNGIIIVLGVNTVTDKIDWARAATGMPVGNEALLQQLRYDLVDAPLDANLVGRPGINLATEQTVHSDGLIESILWGENAFSRVSMSGDGIEGQGFSYLESSIQIKPIAYWLTGIVNVLLVAGAAGGALYWNDSLQTHRRGSNVYWGRSGFYHGRRF